MKPIASVLGMNHSAPQTSASHTTNQSGSHTKTDTTTTDTNANQDNDKDEDSDVTPPRLVSAEWLPPAVQDGETTIFNVNVTDDISGVKSVSGVLVGPGTSGAQQGFACQRDLDSGRFLSHITIPKDAAEGNWTIRYLTLMDNAGNTANLSSSQGTLMVGPLKVTSSGSDSKGPTLKAIWLENQSMQAGDKNQVFVQADDDKSGVNLVSGVFVSPSKQARMGFGCRLQDVTWQCPVTPPSCVECGTWTLEQVQLQDKANNMTTVRADNQMVAQVRLEIYGKECDRTPPALVSISLDPQVVSNAEGGVIHVTAVATDDQCGVASLSGMAQPPGGSSRIYFPLRPAAEGSDTFIGEIQVPQHAASGLWTIGWIQALDKGHNLKAYSAGDPVISRVTFRVQ